MGLRKALRMSRSTGPAYTCSGGPDCLTISFSALSGNGLSARCFIASLTWIEIDFPNVLNWKAQALAGHDPACKLIRAPADLTKPHAVQEAVKDIPTEGKCLIVMENLLHYLDGLQTQNFFQDIRSFGSANMVLVDIGSPALPTSTLGKVMFGELEKAGSQRAGIADIAAFAGHAGYRVLQSFPLFALRGAPDSWKETAPWYVSRAKQDLLRIVVLERT
ncbi:hypothetical protein DCC77_00890 [Candidatus Uhrbacteria bacterium]|nr:MAG: hypothetical protein DCC77_00890 [Candidatus Uhrbacteria bacterium]